MGAVGAHAGSAVLVAAVVVALATVGMTAAVAGGRPAPGTLVRADPIDTPAGAHTSHVQYTSRALDGHDVVESGVVVAPDGAPPSGGRPVVSWAHGTTGLADTSAPSLAPGVVDRLPWLRELLDRGVVIAATDYEGLGTPGPHPYLVGDSEGRSVLDIARAAQQVEGTGANNVVVAMGHSQGGHAALFAGELRVTVHARPRRAWRRRAGARRRPLHAVLAVVAVVPARLRADGRRRDPTSPLRTPTSTR